MFSWENLDTAVAAYDKLVAKIAALKNDGDVDQEAFGKLKERFVNALNGEETIEQAAEEVKKSSRHYAKRQLTWFRRNPAMHWLSRQAGQKNEEILTAARQIIYDFDS